jgi:hypothetical protein
VTLVHWIFADSSEWRYGSDSPRHRVDPQWSVHEPQCIHKSLNHLPIPPTVATVTDHWGSVTPQSPVSIAVTVVIQTLHLVLYWYHSCYSDCCSMMAVAEDAPQDYILMVAGAESSYVVVLEVEIGMVDALAYWVVAFAIVAVVVVDACSWWVVDTAIAVCYYYFPHLTAVVVAMVVDGSYEVVVAVAFGNYDDSYYYR